MDNSLGPYRLLRLLGEGGMGQVFEARDNRDDSRVAIKTLRGGAAATDREKELFAREGRAGMEISHPGLVKVLAVEIQFTDRPYLVMEYLPGPTLKAIVKEGGLDLRSALSLVLPILETLAHVHEQGVIHRDVKTGNLMLDHDGHPRLMDFGLTSFSDETSLSRTGLVFGSPHYMSPEQGLGEQLDLRSDLFSLAIVLFELLTGRLPFRGTTPLSVVYAIVNQEPPLLRRIRPETPAALDWVLAKGLTKNRENRYQSARHFAADIKQVLALLAGQVDDGDLDLIARPEQSTVDQERLPLPLVGREREASLIQSWLRRQEEPAILFLAGEAGVGKTRLMREALSRAGISAPGAIVGRAQPGRENFPYQPWLEALRTTLRERELLDQKSLGELLSRFSPGGDDRVGLLWPLLSGQGESRAEGQEQLFEAMRGLLVTLNGLEPLLIWLEDLHRTDHASIEFLTFLSRCPAGELPLVAVTYRDEEIATDAPLLRLIHDLETDGLALTLTLPRLGEESVLRLLEDLLPDLPDPGRAAHRLHRESRGNPFILRELLEILREKSRHLADDPEQWELPLPARLQDLVEHRLRGLSREERETLELAAVEGEAFTAEVLAALLEERKIRVLRRLQSLERETRLVQAREGRFLFDHALVRRALYESLGEELRTEYHSLIAEHLTATVSDLPGRAADIARHWLGSGQTRRAVSHLLKAGIHARSLYAPHEARRHLQRAREEVDIWWLEEPDGKPRELRIAILRELGQLDQTTGNFQQALDLFRGARSLLTPGLEERDRAELDRLCGEALRYSGQDEDAAVEYAQAMEHCPGGDRRQMALILRSRAHLELVGNDWDAAMASCDAAILCCEAYPHEMRAIDHMRGIICMSRGDLEQARRIFQDVIDRATDDREQYLRTAALANQGTVLWRLGETDAAESCLEESLAIRGRLGLVIEYAQILTNLAIIRTKTGRLGEARKLLEESRDLKLRIGNPAELASVENSLGGLEARVGKLAKALQHCRRAVDCHLQAQNPARAAVALLNSGELLLDMNRPTEALPLLERSREIRAELGLEAAGAVSAMVLGRCLATLDRGDDAEAVIADVQEIMERVGSFKDKLMVGLARLNYLVTTGRPAEGRTTLTRLQGICPDWPPAGYLFEGGMGEVHLLQAEGKYTLARKLLLPLLDSHPADSEPYRRGQILISLLGCEDTDIDPEILTSWRDEYRALIREHDFTWLDLPSGD
jgi:eukaryotic-like serine/threonine-protein kinase